MIVPPHLRHPTLPCQRPRGLQGDPSPFELEKNLVEIGDYLSMQKCFKKEKNNNGIIKSIQQITNKMKKTVYAVFVDLTAAFDHVERGWVFKSIKNRLPEGFDLELIQLLESLYSNTTTALAETPNDVF